jgi:formate dehydrogenase major subunit
MGKTKLIKSSQGNKNAVTSINPQMGRRGFLKIFAATSAITGLGLTPTFVKKVNAANSPYANSKIVKTVCTHCAVGCGVYAEVQNGVWVRQEVAFDHPVSRGGHCCKGAGAIDMVTSEKRLKYPLKKVAGNR